MRTIELDYDKVFRMFCGNNELRPNLMQPFYQGEYTFASDAYTMIYTKQRIGEYQEQDSPNALAVIPAKKDLVKEISVKSLQKILRAVPLIDEEMECEECEGSGEMECNLGHTHPCEECYGDGTKGLTGKKIKDPEAIINLLDTNYSFEHLNRLCEAAKELGIQTISAYKSDSNYLNLIFEAGDFSFVIAPQTKEI